MKKVNQKKIMKLLSIILITFLLTVPVFSQVNSYNVLTKFIPSGYMGDVDNIQMVSNHSDNCKSDSRCMRVIYTPGDSGWAGVYWQYPANNWCDKNLTGRNISNLNFTKLTFWARGENGREEVKFKVGYNECGSCVTDENIEYLTKDWKQYSIDLSEMNLSDVRGGFCWVVDSKANSGVVTFYLDDVKFE